MNMRKKEGFTLIELLAVIGLLLVLGLLILPNTMNILDKETDKTMELQKKEIEDATLLYIEDYCDNPISHNVCPFAKSLDNRTNLYKYNGSINISVLVNNKYINPVYFKDKPCDGTVKLVNGDMTVTLNCE